MATGQLLRVVHTILTIIAEQVEANPLSQGRGGTRLAEHIFPGDILSRPEVKHVPDLLPCTTSGCADWMAGCIDRSLSDGDLRNTLVAPSAPPPPPRLWLTMVQEAGEEKKATDGLAAWSAEATELWGDGPALCWQPDGRHLLHGS
ncbi:hypothetical protein ACROYT_G022362 [Oculina patagonica]